MLLWGMCIVLCYMIKSCHRILNTVHVIIVLIKERAIGALGHI